MKLFAVLFRTSIIAALMGLMFGAVAADECPLCKAANDGNLAEVKRLIAAGADLNALNSYGSTALHRAAFKNRPKIAKMLLTAGADVDVNSSRGHTALHWATQSGNAEVVKVLLDAGANPDRLNGVNKTAWELIRGRKRLEYVFEKAIEEWYEEWSENQP